MKSCLEQSRGSSRLQPRLLSVMTGALGVVQRALTSLLSHTGPEVTQNVSSSLSYPRPGWQHTRGGPGAGPPQNARLCLIPNPCHSPESLQPPPRARPLPGRSHQTGLKVNNSLPQAGAGSGREQPSWGARGGRGARAEPGKTRRVTPTRVDHHHHHLLSFHTPELYHS